MDLMPLETKSKCIRNLNKKGFDVTLLLALVGI